MIYDLLPRLHLIRAWELTPHDDGVIHPHKRDRSLLDPGYDVPEG